MRKKRVGEIIFMNATIPVYYNPVGVESVVWQMRNPGTCYTGIMYMNTETRKISYPENAIIPEQTDEDREIIPKIILINEKKLTPEDEVSLLKHLEQEFTRRNNKK